MSQHDYAIANDTAANVRTDINAALPALASNNSGASAPATMFANQWWVDTTNALLKRRDPTNAFWVVQDNWASVRVISASGATTAGLADWGKLFLATGTWSLAFSAVATLTDGWWAIVRNVGTGTITLDPSTTELIDGASTVSLAAGESCLVRCDGAALYTVGRWPTASAVTLPRGYLSGFTLGNNVTDPTNDVDVTAGTARDDTNAYDLTNAVTVVKQIDVTFAEYSAPGTASGGRESGRSLATGWWHVFVIGGSGKNTQPLFSDRLTPSLPSGFTYQRRVGSVYWTGTAIRAFSQYGDEFLWSVPIGDINVTNPGTSAVTRTLSVPTGVKVDAIIASTIFGTDAGGYYCLLSAFDQADTAPSAAVFTLAVSGGVSGVGEVETSSSGARVRTNTSAQIRSRQSASYAAASMLISTHGWSDPRGRND